MRYVAIVLGALFFWTWLAIPACGCSTRQRAYAAAMRSDLKNLASQQEIYYADHQAFSDDAERLQFTHTVGVVVTLDLVGDAGWMARATHEAFEERDGVTQDCVIYDGRVPDPPRTSLRERVPEGPGALACDPDPSRSLKRRIQDLIFP